MQLVSPSIYPPNHESIHTKTRPRNRVSYLVTYGLGADFSLPHCLVGDKVSENIAEPSPAGKSEPRAEISWCIVMVQRSGKVSGGTAVDCIFLSFLAILILRLASRPKTS